jgi:hypothetical protein
MKPVCIAAPRQQATPIPATFAKLGRQKAIQSYCRIKGSVGLSYLKLRVGPEAFRAAESSAQLIESKKGKNGTSE